MISSNDPPKKQNIQFIRQKKSLNPHNDGVIQRDLQTDWWRKKVFFLKQLRAPRSQSQLRGWKCACFDTQSSFSALLMRMWMGLSCSRYQVRAFICSVVQMCRALRVTAAAVLRRCCILVRRCGSGPGFSLCCFIKALLCSPRLMKYFRKSY